MEALCQVGALSPGLKPSDSVQDFPDGDAGETHALVRNRAQDPDDPSVGLTPPQWHLDAQSNRAGCYRTNSIPYRFRNARQVRIVPQSELQVILVDNEVAETAHGFVRLELSEGDRLIGDKKV